MQDDTVRENAVCADTRQKVRWIAEGWLAVGLLLAGCSSDGAETEATDETSQSEEESETTPNDESESAETAPSSPAVFQDDAQPFAVEFAPIATGTHRIESVGTPFTFSIEGDFFVQPNSFAQFVLTHPDSRAPDDRDIVIMRLTALSDPSDPSVFPETFDDGWPVDDFDGWLDALGDSLIVTAREQTTLGGLEAIRVDFELAADACVPGGDFCVLLGVNQNFMSKNLSIGSRYSIWHLDQGDEDPLVVVVGINRQEDSAWFDTADVVLSSLAFGDVGSNPLVLALPGPLELPFLGGVGFEVSEQAIVPLGSAVKRVSHMNEPVETWFVTNPADINGNVLESTDSVVAAMDAAGSEVIEIDPTAIGGLEARVFDIAASGSGGPSLQLTVDGDRPYGTPPRGRMWLIEHPERGVLMITAEVFFEPDAFFPIALAQTEPIIESLEFVDLG